MIGRVGTALFAIALAALIAAYVGGYRLAIISGGSMEPAIAFGSIALLEPVSAEHLRPGEIAAYRVGEHPVLHRVVAVDVPSATIATRGDANAAPEAAIAFENVHARYVGSIPKAGIPLLAAREPGAWPGLLLIASGMLLVVLPKGRPGGS